jgi:acetyl-CoA/propionyl-CoA carboxylase biotin carboxyl carrier protein
MPFRRVFVANRGEIAVRVFRTCGRLGIETVAAAAPDDRGALHTREADTVAEVASYLDAADLVRAALEAGADAVHPGYGFLAESADFAAGVEQAGLTWIGPPSAVLRLGGDKLEAKRVALAAGVPVTPSGTPAEVGLPLLVKAAAGGGGRGMRIVRDSADLAEALEAAAREAESAFGDGTVFCERYLERPRHVEVQLLADAHGTVVSLGQRDCSVQRRHQKVVEESPPPGLPAAVASALDDAAIAFASAIGYVGAGTAEFLVDGDDAYFLELNGRIQVEHPVTEAVTGLDLVEQQLRVAAGELLVTDRHKASGHAIEVRLYAEDPRTFLPQTGKIERLALPSGVRVDAGVEEGDEIGTRYDPLIAKLIAHGADRGEAVERLAVALAETAVGGLVTNLPFLRWLVGHPSFRTGPVTTAFLVEHPPLSAMPLRLPTGAWREPWRLNLASPAPASPPNVDAAAHEHAHGSGGSIAAPMPGTVLAVHVAPGDTVEPRQPVVTLEAMKMEHPVAAPFAATIAAVHVDTGDSVSAGELLVEFESEGVVSRRPRRDRG